MKLLNIKSFAFKLVIIMSLFSFILSICGLLYSDLNSYLFFYFPLCWFAWLFSSLWISTENAKRIVISWLLIDCSILITFLISAKVNGNIDNSIGSEFAWAISYLPMLFPSALLINNLTNYMTIETTHVFTPILGVAYTNVINDWVSASIVAMAQAVIYCIAVKLISKIVNSLRAATL